MHEGNKHFSPNLLFLLARFFESFCPGLQHLCSLFKSHINLLAHWKQTLGEIHVIFLEKLDGNKDEINIVETQSSLFSVLFLLLEEGQWMISPMSTRIQVVRCMVTVVEGETVTL